VRQKPAHGGGTGGNHWRRPPPSSPRAKGPIGASMRARNVLHPGRDASGVLDFQNNVEKQEPRRAERDQLPSSWMPCRQYSCASALSGAVLPKKLRGPAG